MNYESKRWLYLGLCIICNICAGIIYAWSVFVKPIADHFQWTIADASLSFTIMTTVGACLPMFVGKLQERVQSRMILIAGGVLLGGGLLALSSTTSLTQLYIFSMVTGLGLTLVYPSGTVSNIVKFFPDKRGLASGLLTGGASLGAVIWAPVGAILTETLGVPTTFKLMGIVFMVTIVFAAWLVETAPAGYYPHTRKDDASARTGATEIADTVTTVQDLDWKDMLRSPLFYMIGGAFFSAATSSMMFFGHVSPIAQDMLGISAKAASGVVVLLAIANTSGRMVWGWISDKLGRFKVINILLVLLVIAMIGMTQVSSYFAFASMVMIVGLCYGGFFSIIAPLLADMFGERSLAVNFGIMFLMVGAGAFVGPRLAALLKIATGSYVQAFVTAGVFNLVGIGLVFLASSYWKKQTTESAELFVQLSEK
ncbi:L-lactate MFS transporter [Sporomusa malonica]|uniref:MFS transporter, OFA family, oxalate/formate antiporter n=1 Tax=Sporomusa malonica TaxID=112901 RepID=A0A1W2E6Y5_9FIRM|nr:OFA family MFS transporter [Sporomusa malonica]SMD05543.1 MFS transporter, OFA family, oxalate/formate antiporter [Sporomusa malonica]